MRLRRVSLAIYLACAAVIVLLTVPAAGWKALNVLTPSMKPALSPGTLALVHRVPYAQLQPGNVITYQDPHHTGVTITHRLVAKVQLQGVPAVVTKGDANATPDAAVPAGRIVGRVAWSAPSLGHWLASLRTPLALVLLIIVPGLLVMAYELRRLRRLLRIRPARRRRAVDGLHRASALVALGVTVLLAAGTAWAATTTSAALTGNFFTTTSSTTPTPSPSVNPTPNPSPTPTRTPTPTPSPRPSDQPCAGPFSISNTGPGSVNIITCNATFLRSF